MAKKSTLTLRIFLMCLLTAATLVYANAQVANYSFAQSAGTYVPITGGTVLGTQTGFSGAASLDDVTYTLAAATIPFPFTFDGTVYTGLFVNTNGHITFGSSPGTTNYQSISGTGTNAGAIAAFSRDIQAGFVFTADRTLGSDTLLNVSSSAALVLGQVLNGTGITAGSTIIEIGTGFIRMSTTATSTGVAGTVTAATGEIRYETIGTTPNQEFVIQWTGFKSFGTTLANVKDMRLNFQIRLSETTNTINVVYGDCTPGTITTNLAPQVGLRGPNNTFATNVNNRLVDVTNNWSTSLPGVANNSALRFVSTAPASVITSGQTYTWTPPVPCAGIPTAGATVASTNPVCPGVSFTLSMPSAPTGVAGLTYQWISSPDDVTYSNISGATSAIRSDTTTSIRYYRSIITCTNSGLSDTSTAIMITLLPAIQCYCTPTYSSGCGSNDYIANVTLNTLSNSSVCTPTPFYTFYNSVTIPDVPQLVSTTLSITFGADGSQFAGVWIDFNQDGDFGDTDEFVAFNTVNAGANGTATFNIVVPLTATLGQTRMRIRGGNDSQLANTPCGASSSSFGETEDYLINITAAPPCAPPNTISFNAITDSAATVTWVSLGIVSNIEYGTLGFTQGTGTVISGVNSPYTITGLNPQTGYSVYITDSCLGSLSTATGPSNFTTLCSPYPYPGDNAAGAIVVGSYPFTDTVNTTTDPCYNDDSPLRTGKDIYYRFTADPCATSVTVSLCGSSFDTYLYIRDAADTVTIALNDDECGLQSQYTLSGTQLVPGATYLAVLEPFSSGATGEYIVNITQTLGATTPGLSTISTSATCPNTSDGGAQVIVTANAVSPLTYIWNLGQTTDTISGLAPGDYSVTVTNGCGGTNTTTVTVFSDFFAYGDVTNVSCNSGNNGAIDLVLDGETSPVFAWGGGEVTEDLDTLTAGVYSVVVTDGACIFADSFEVFEPSPLALSLDSITNVSCNGGNNGAVEITVTGGTINPDISGQLSTTFADNNGCGGGNMFDLQVNANLQVTGVDIHLNTSGVVNIYVKPGTYQGFLTTPGAWTLVYSGNITTLGPGVPTPVVFPTPLPIATGLYGIYVNADLAYTDQPLGTTYSTPEMTLTVGHGLCSLFGGTNAGRAWNGNIHYTIPGDPYTYIWSNGDSTEDISGLTANNYTVSVTDANSCSLTSTAFTVTEPALLSVVIDSSTNVSCNADSTGAVYITVSGGTQPYDYSWTGGSVDEDPTGLAAGTYSAAVSDNNGCVASTSNVTITEPTAIAIAVDSIIDVLCSNSLDGAIYVTISGGVSPYTNTWSNNVTTEDLVGVYPDTYTNAVTDANGCIQTSAPATISSAPPLVLTVDSTLNVTCNGGNDGSICTSISGGTSPYTILWDNGDTTLCLSDLGAGSYLPTVTDSNGCVYPELPVTITEPSPLSPSVDSIVNVKCNGGSDGGIYISVTGGTTPYSFAWSNGTSNEDLVNVPAGTYTGTLTDANGCISASPPVPITEPAVLAASIDSVSNVKCNGESSGAIYVTITGGTTPYSPLWTGGGSTEDLTSIADGTYTQTVTDANGCVLIGVPVSVTEPSVLLLGVDSITNVNCNGASTGCVSITVGGGTAPYGILWSNGSSSEDLCNLASGPYTPTITDANGCILVGQANVVTQPANALSASSVSTDEVQGGALGAIDLSPSGGTAPYDFDWSNGATTEDLTGLAAGVYTATITDANGCTEVVSDTINLIIGIENVTDANFSVSVYPNPTENHAFVEVALNSSGEVSAEIYNVNGQLINGYYSANTRNVKFDMSFEKEAAGVYYVKIKSGDSVVTKRIVVTR